MGLCSRRLCNLGGYNEISGRSNADYYSAYLDAIVEHLRQTGKLDRTLIVLTSDHGYRGHATLAERYAYHIPLWLYATRLSAREDARLFSHIDFQALLLHELGAGAAPQAADPFVMIVGPTGISSLAVLDAAGDIGADAVETVRKALMESSALPRDVVESAIKGHHTSK